MELMGTDGSHGGGGRGQEGLSIPRLSSTPAAPRLDPWRKNPGVRLSGLSVLRHQGDGRLVLQMGDLFFEAQVQEGLLSKRGGGASWQGAPAMGPLPTGGGGSLWEGAMPLVPDPWVGEVYPSGHQD